MWRIVIPDWVPPSLNTSRGRHWTKGAANTEEVCEMVKAYALKAGVPLVKGAYRPRRGLSVDVVKSGKLPDPDNLLKHLLDGLKKAGLIVDDRAGWCEWSTPSLEQVSKDMAGKGTVLVLWDLPEPVQAEQSNPLSCLSMPELITGDCEHVLAQVETGSAQLVFADPPFNIGYHYDKYDDSVRREDYLNFAARWIKHCARILTPQGSMFVAIGDEYAAEYKLLLHDSGLHFRNWIVWEYAFGEYQDRKFGRNHAHILYFTKDPKRFTFNADAIREPSARQTKYKDKRAVTAGRVPGDVWHFPRVCGTFTERTGHPCQMPESVLERIVRVASNKGNVVLDPFAGSGTTLAVAKRLGRVGRGIELSADYATETRQRLARVTPVVEPDPELFG